MKHMLDRNLRTLVNRELRKLFGISLADVSELTIAKLIVDGATLDEIMDFIEEKYNLTRIPEVVTEKR